MQVIHLSEARPQVRNKSIISWSVEIAGKRRPTRFDHTARIVVCGIGGGSGVSSDRRRTSFDIDSGTDDSFALPIKTCVV